MRLENMVRACLIYGMGKSSSKSLRLLIGSFPGRRICGGGGVSFFFVMGS